VYHPLQDLLPISQDVADQWARKFLEIQEHARKEQRVDLIWGFVDGFLLYWHPVSSFRQFMPFVANSAPPTQDIVHELDVRLFLRVSYDTLKARREKRFGYHTAGGSRSLTGVQFSLVRSSE
jgi:nicotinamide/nicotinate riboside kinase